MIFKGTISFLSLPKNKIDIRGVTSSYTGTGNEILRKINSPLLTFQLDTRSVGQIKEEIVEKEKKNNDIFPCFMTARNGR